MMDGWILKLVLIDRRGVVDQTTAAISAYLFLLCTNDIPVSAWLRDVFPSFVAVGIQRCLLGVTHCLFGTFGVGRLAGHGIVLFMGWDDQSKELSARVERNPWLCLSECFVLITSNL